MADEPSAGVVPYVVVSDGAAAIAFYTKAFGARNCSGWRRRTGSRLSMRRCG